MNKHQLRTEATKRKLLKSARRIFARDGFEASRIDEIARDAGFTRGAFYAHFSDKEQLFLALVEEQAVRRVEELRILLVDATNDAARMEIIRAFYAASVSDRSWCILLLEFKLYALRHVKRRAKLTQAHRRVRDHVKFEHLAELLPTAFLSDAYRKEQVRLALEALLCGLVLQQAYDPASLSKSQARDLLAECFDSFISHD